jgi:hypothetical protein
MPSHGVNYASKINKLFINKRLCTGRTASAGLARALQFSSRNQEKHEPGRAMGARSIPKSEVSDLERSHGEQGSI